MQDENDDFDDLVDEYFEEYDDEDECQDFRDTEGDINPRLISEL